jgi:D-beta-D-heptose 7-phosphate kinase/D-beta-D-heptose 1-phosphate adenosyltransferase
MQQPESWNILLIGDSCIDEYIYGTCERLNPEAPVPVLNYSKKIVTQGMAHNVYNNLKSFGLNVYFMTNEEKIIKTRFIDEKSDQQILRLDKEVKIKPLEKIPNFNWDAIIISDYNKGFITKEKIFEITETYKCPIFIDSKKDDLPTKNCLIKINNIEAKKLKSNNQNLIITMGARGAMFRGYTYIAEPVKVHDVVGAGDTFLASLAYGYTKTKSISSAIRLANKCSAIAVQNRGTYVLTQDDIQNINYE